MAFPVSPTNNQTAIVNGIVHVYSSAENSWSRFSSPPGNLTVTGNLTSSGNLLASNVYLSSLYWAANGSAIPIGYGNTEVGIYLTTGTVAITDLSVGDSLVQQDALNLNNNNLYGVNTIRINDPGTSEGIAWEGGSGWNIYESPNDLSNDVGNLQIVLSGTRVFTVDTNSTVNIPSTWPSRSTTTGALTVAGGVGIGGNLWVGGDIYASNLISISSSTLSVTDPLLYLTASDLTPYNYDIGFFSHFIGGSLNNYQHTGFARNATDNTWTFFSNVFAEPGVAIDWTEANIIFDPIKAGSANIANTTVSTSTTTGALVVGGGAGISGALYIANTGDVSANIGAYQIYANANAAAQTTAMDVISANIGAYQIYSNANVGAYQTYANSNAAAQTTAIDTINANIGEFYAYANTKIGTNNNSNLVVQSTEPSTSAVTGALVVKGGVGVAGNVYAADRVFTTNGLYWAGNGSAFSSGATPAGSDTYVQFNDGGSALGADSTFAFNKTSKILSIQQLSVTNSSGDEGGEILLAKPATNTTLSGTGVTVDIYQNRLRFFEQGGSARGYYLDITSGGGGASTNLISGGGGGGTPAGSTGDIQFNNGGAFGATSLFYDSANGNIVLTDTTDSTSTTTGALVVRGGVGIAGALYIANTGDVSANIGTVLLGQNTINANLGAYQIYSNANIGTLVNNINSISTNANANVAAYLPVHTGNIQAGNASIITNLSVAVNVTNTDALNLNNNNLYNVNTIRINDPGNSEGISWEGGSGWNIYESPDDLSNDIGNLQIVLSGVRTLTVTTDGTVNIPSTAAATSTTSGALTIGGGVGVVGNVVANKFYTTAGLYWAGNGVAFSSGGGGGGGITYTSDTTPPGTPNIGDQWYNTSTDVLYEYLEDGTSSYWVDIQSLGTSTGNAVTVSLDDLTLGGNLILTANLVYSIGGDTGRLKTIWAGNVISRTANVDTINTGVIAATGNVTAANVTATNNIAATRIVATGNVTAANITTVGNVEGNYMLGDGSKLTNLPVTGATTGKAIAMAIVFGG